jgi:hypothetical protein
MVTPPVPPVPPLLVLLVLPPLPPLAPPVALGSGSERLARAPHAASRDEVAIARSSRARFMARILAQAGARGRSIAPPHGPAVCSRP